MIGRTVSHYRILSKLGEGGMGVVYKAQDLKLSRFVALKFLTGTAGDDGAKKRFIHEAEAASSLDHPNICGIHEIDETADGRLFIVMPCYEGESLQARIKRGPLKMNEAVEIAIQVASGLSKAHEKGIVHRDIKPGNVFITNDGLVKIVDFGLAKLSTHTRLTRSGAAAGTTMYMSPEQLRGGTVDQRSDIWAFGVVLYEMITAETPFRGEYEQAVGYSIVNEAPKPLRGIRPDVPIELESLVEKLLSKDPGDRFQKATDVLAGLRSLQARLVPASVDGVGSGPHGGAAEAPSIAVLPFTNMSPDPENQYFGDGLAEELINALAQIKGLRVAARTSTFRFRGEGLDIREIGEKLNVRTVLEGSVRRVGNRLRATAQLINIEDGYHIWSERFDREMRDIFEVQDEITRAIVSRLRVKLVGPKDRVLVSSCTNNLEAYSAFLQGRFYWNSLTPEGWVKSLELFQKAIELDPSFALPYGWLAQHYGSRCFWGDEAPKDVMFKARQAAEKALELDDTIATAYGQLAGFFWLFDWDLAAAERAFKRSFELDPGANSALGRTIYAIFLALRGRKHDAVREARLSLKLDPLSGLVAAWAGSVFHCVGEARESVEIIQRGIAMDPDHWQLWFQLASAYLNLSMEEEAAAAYEKAADLSGGVSAPLGMVAATHYLTGRSAEADQLVDLLQERSKRVYVAPSLFAFISVARGEPKAALDYVKHAIEERDSWLDFIKMFPAQIRPTGPAVEALLEKTGLR